VVVWTRAWLVAQCALTSERRRAAPLPVTVKVMIGPLLMERRVKPALARFQETHPHIDLQFVPFAPSTDGASTVRRGEADLMLYTGALPQADDGITTEVVSRISWSLYGVPALVRPVLQGNRAVNDLPFLLCPDHFRITQWTLEQFHRKGVVPFNIAERPPLMDTLLQMVLAGKGIGMFFDIEMAAHMRAGRVLPCGPVFDPVARVMVLGPRARSPEATPVLAFLRHAVRRDDEIIATQHARLGRPGLLANDDSGGLQLQAGL
jgi:DNA-binding transcriptional LysR family regulator